MSHNLEYMSADDKNKACTIYTTAALKILVTLANYGTKNDVYLRRLLDEYRSMSHNVHVVVISDQAKDLGPDVTVHVERPTGDPWTFPFAHKRILAEHCDDHDLFIYSEDDTLITERNIQAFLRATDALAEDEIAGFLRYEVGTGGRRYCSSIHSHFHWDPQSVVRRGDGLFAFFSNEHSASYILTRKQLRKAIDSGGYLVSPHQEKYDLLVTAATDPYTQCGFRRLIDIAHLEDFLLPHLPNKYLGQFGISVDDLQHQAEALKSIAAGARPAAPLFHHETGLPGGKWSKSYYETPRTDIQNLIPPTARTVLSYGCGWGEAEASLAAKGRSVTAVPIDPVIGACAEARGIRTVYATQDSPVPDFAGEQFDCILIPGVLHLLPNPVLVLTKLAALLSPGGSIVCSVPNMSQLPVRWRRLAGRRGYRDLGSYRLSGIHLCSPRILRRWLSRSGLTIARMEPRIPSRARRAYSVLGRMVTGLLASELLVVAKKHE